VKAPFKPMTLRNMRQNDVRAVIATCQVCGHKADVNVDALAGTVIVPTQVDNCNAANAEGSGSRRGPRGIRRDSGVVLRHSPEVPRLVAPVGLALKC
jgi:hypothetical protein